LTRISAAFVELWETRKKPYALRPLRSTKRPKINSLL